MANPIIQIRRSAVAGKIPTTTQLSLGELAINTYDGKVYIEQDQGAVGVGTTVIVINPWNVGLGSTAYNTYFTVGNVGIGTTNPTEKLDILGKIQIEQDSSSNNRLVFRGQPGSSYRWNIDNYSSSNQFRIFREDDATSANGFAPFSISTTGTLSATRFSGDGSLLTGITASGSGVVIQNQGSTVGTATTINFSTNLNASFGSGTATVTLSNNPSITGILTADQIYTSNNGNGTNIRIGDDAWLGDINVANTTRLSGAQDSTKGFIVFGSSDTVALGRTGTGPLYYGGDLTVSGIVTASSFSGNATSATYAISAGVATYATSSGIATYASNAGVATYSDTAGIATYATSAGIATNVKGTGSRVLYNSTTDTTTTSSNLTFDGTTLAVNSTPGANVSALSLTGTPFGSNTKNGLLGVGTLGFNDVNVIANFAASVNSYSQVVLQNLNTGNASSADFIVNNDRAGGTTYYGDFGINGTGYNGGGPFGDTDGTYLYAAGGTLSVGTLDALDFRIATGSAAATPVTRVTVTGVGGSVGIDTTNPKATLQVGTGITMYGATGIISAVSYRGDGSQLTGISASGGVSISTNTTNENQYISYATSFGSTTGLGATTLLVYNPSTKSLGIGTTNPSQPLHVQGNARVAGAVYDSTNSPGTSGQVLQSTVTGTQWTTAAAGGGGGGSGKFDTTIDNVLYIQPTGTLDIVGVGTTTTQITTLPSGSNKYIVHSIHVTNISNGDAEITAGFIINANKVPAAISVSVGQSGAAGINTFTVGSASSITVGMAVTGTGNIGETTGIGSTAGFQFNTYVTSVDGTIITVSKPLSGRATGTLFFSPVSKVASRLPVPVGSAVELLKQPMVLNALDSIVVQSTGAGSGIGSTSTAAISQTSGSNLLTVTAGAAITNFIAAGQLIQGTGSNTGIQTNTFVGVGYTPGQLTVPMTRPATSTLASQILSFTEVVTPQDGALQATIVYQTTTDTSYLNGTGTVAGISSVTTSVTAGLSTVPVAYYSTGNTYPSIIQSIRVTNISDGSIYPGGDYPVWVGIGNSDTIFSWLAYNMIIPKNSSIELCESPKRIGIGQSIYAYAANPYTIDIQVAGKQKTS